MQLVDPEQARRILERDEWPATFNEMSNVWPEGEGTKQEPVARLGEWKQGSLDPDFSEKRTREFLRKIADYLRRPSSHGRLSVDQNPVDLPARRSAAHKNRSQGAAIGIPTPWITPTATPVAAQSQVARVVVACAATAG